MSERGTPGDGPPACPFIAFEDERDERSSSPDHRHRCFAEVTPAPRALAHQEAYCLSSAFPVCPTFQDWARREAAQARASGRAPNTAGVAVGIAAASEVRDDVDEPVASYDDPVRDPDPPTYDAHDDAVDEDDDDLWSGQGTPSEPPARRNPPRDWAAPPPWASGGAGAAGAAGAAGGSTGAGSGAAGGGTGTGSSSGSGSGSSRSTRPPGSASSPRSDSDAAISASRAASAGLAGSAADRIASGQPGASAPHSPPSDDLAGLVAPAAPRATPKDAPLTRPPTGSHPTTTASGRRPTVSSTRSRTASPPPDHDGPSWETARRYEAYPTIKTRAGLPGIPRVILWVGVLVIAAAALFFLPDALDLVGGGGGASPTASPTSSVAATAEPTETPIPEPTPQTYTIKKGDTLNKIAKKYKLTLDELLAANKQTIKNADKIKVGQTIIIPVPAPDEFTDPSAATPSDEASPEDSPAP